MGQRRKDRELHWRGVLKQQFESGLSVARFCRQESISVQSFYAWRRKLKERDADQNRVDESGGTMVARKQLLPVRIEAKRAPVRILLPQGVSVEVPGSIADDALVHLLRSVREAAGC